MLEKQDHIKQLDVFRALAALSVCAVHFTYESFFHKYFAEGIFVQLFFTLSGFVIFLNYSDKINNLEDFKNFIFKRFKRLYPLHLFFLILFLLVEFLKYFLNFKFGMTPNITPFEINNLNNFFLNLFFLQHFAEMNNFNSPSWSISVEMMLYVTFSIIIFINRRSLIFILFFYIILFLFLLKNTYGSTLSIDAYYSGLYSFSIGCLFCVFYKKKNFFFKNLIFNYLFYFLLTIFFIEIFYLKFISAKYIYSFIFGLIFYLSCFLNSNFYLFKICFNNFFIYLGKISYSIYLSHLLIFFIINNFLKFFLKVPTFVNPAGNLVLKLSFFEANLYTTFAYILTIVISSFTYKYIEIKFYKK